MYTMQEENLVKEMYSEGIEVQDIAEKVGKSEKSVIGKLVSLQIYKPKVRVSKITGSAPKTKKDFVKDIEQLLDVDELKDLDKAPKTTLIKLKGAIEDWLGHNV